jgi:hypothetical protein
VLARVGSNAKRILQGSPCFAGKHEGNSFKQTPCVFGRKLQHRVSGEEVGRIFLTPQNGNFKNIENPVSSFVQQRVDDGSKQCVSAGNAAGRTDLG